ncbi:uncharacterized protein K452DRAFT_299285 [Aplosporella prunicola CBS 121167]|uniref:SPRY domain-containing protein n=1 Tax=Aplosporella prunicola CBS 121167 TaxID=1176127 RepID=A0A6A6BAC6_9PEZI|nr:uncharacterized protein K452DRAFT_299285 [Aplosporella prunicola CBS 121167]KAF2140538.1 hypothetical protein K452DRAFT_299285 [Aplosporella prunicola CBS 121167]
MADPQPPSRGTTPGLTAGVKRAHEEDHVPAVPSPLNPDSAARPRPARPPQREQREKRETLKKREATASSRANTPDSKGKAKVELDNVPLNYLLEESLQLAHFDPPKDATFVSHEPPLLTPDGTAELKRLSDHASNRRAYRYYHCVADPLFRHKQFYRQSDIRPFAPHLSFEDSDKWIHFDDTATILTNERGWRMSRGNVVAREGRYYYEVKIIRGVPAEGPPVPKGQESNPQPHIRMGWARREAPLDAPVGFDGYSYGVKDIGFESMHRSRPARLYNSTSQGAKKNKPPGSKVFQVDYVEEDHIREGDIIGLELTLPSISLHRKVVEGIYNPAVDVSDGFDDPVEAAHDIIRDRIPVPFKANMWFEVNEYQPTKPMESYADRGTSTTVHPSPNNNDVPLRSLPHSSIKVYKNGKPVGTAFEGLMSFLPPASSPIPSNNPKVRAGLDDGMLGYFPAVAAFCGGIAQVNFGPDFWCPPPELQNEDVDMIGAEAPVASGRKLHAVGTRYKEQVAEDIVWDIIDEVTFFVADHNNSSQNGTIKAAPAARGITNLREDDGF